MENNNLWDLHNISVGKQVILWENWSGRIQKPKVLKVVKVGKVSFKCEGYDILFNKKDGSVRGHDGYGFSHKWITRYTEEQIATYNKREQEEKERNEVLAFVLQTQFRCLSTPTLKAIKEVINNSCELI